MRGLAKLTWAMGCGEELTLIQTKGHHIDYRPLRGAPYQLACLFLRG